MSVTTTAALKTSGGGLLVGPTIGGLKVTMMVQAEVAASIVPQLLDDVKALAPVPAMLIEVIGSRFVSLLVSVNGRVDVPF